MAIGRDSTVEGSFVSSGNLNRGIAYRLESKRSWPKDFHNRVYMEMSDERMDGLGLAWWGITSARLVDWQALRGASAVETYRNGIATLDELDAGYKALVRAHGDDGPMLETTSWKTLRWLFEAASRIKKLKVPSNVFSSKLCHFILPTAFVVVDRQVAPGLSLDYGEHWTTCKKAWNAADNKDELEGILAAAIREAPTNEISVHYPWSTKIVELCLIGSRRPNGKQRMGL